MFELRPYQKEISNKGVDILNKRKIIYLCMEVRTGKTLTALTIAKKYNAKSVLFLTKKKAVPSIESDYKLGEFPFNLTVLNDESMHKLNGSFDLVIHDEHHRFGAYPKPGVGTKLFKEKFSSLPMIFLSGTPHPESYSQIYHQFYVSDFSPFRKYKNFYKWSKDFVNVKKRQLGYAIVNDYSEANFNIIEPMIKPYLIKYTQKDAGFTSSVRETILTCLMDQKVYKIANRLKKDRVIEGKEEVILADTAVKLQQKLHQIYSGTVKFESGNSTVLDDSKAVFIRDTFKNKRIAIFYKFKAELVALKTVFNLTQDVERFNNLEFDVIALQFLSGREGITLNTADCLVYYNIDFSAVTYWQSRDRLTTKERLENDVYWIFAKGGIEEKIYKSVMSKKDYTVRAFKKDYNIY